MYKTLIRLSPTDYSRVEAHRERWLSELGALLSFPTVSSEPGHRPDIQAAADWLAGHLTQIGLQHAQVLPGIRGGPPSVYADWRYQPGKPTLLIYGHYDVQPVDPLNAWHTPPFQATRIGQDLFARGASDDKGQFFLHLKALESYLQTHGHLPLNVKIWLEGEEEINSPNLETFLIQEGRRLSADAVLISDTEMISPGCPSIIFGLRGALTLELEVSGPRHDLHSGRYGGGVLNPLQALCELIAGFHDPEGKILIPGFYNRVLEELAMAPVQCACCGSRDQQILKDLDIPESWGESGYSLSERMTARPALVVNGLSGGYAGPGVKAVIPHKGSAKLSVRLVPNQDPAEIGELIRRHIQHHTPSAVRSRLFIHGGSRPVLLPRKNTAVAAMVRAVRKIWGKAPVFTRSGGTIPMVEQFYKHFQAPIVLMGFGLPDDDIHAPNEKISLPQFFRGVETSIRFLEEYGRDAAG